MNKSYYLTRISYISINLLTFVFFLYSCAPFKRSIYLNDETLTEGVPKFYENKKSEYRVQTNDVLHIQVLSADEEINNIFNIKNNAIGNFGNPGALYVAGYSVDLHGNINLPIVGNLSVRNLTLFEIQNQVQQSIDVYLKNATVIVKLINFRVTVLGEVASPGSFIINNAQVNLFEALGRAGDITEFGNRNNVRIIRQSSDGEEVVSIDITKPGILNSKYFYLQPNDVIYVEPLRSRTQRANLQPVTVAFAGVSTLILLLNYIDNQ